VGGFDELDELMVRFRVHLAAIDRLPERRLARAFAERHAGRVYLVAYDPTARPRSDDWFRLDEDARFVTVRRLEAIDEMMASFRAQRNLLPLDLPDQYVAHLRSLVRVRTADPFGNERVVYQATGPDDFAHAETYDLVAGLLWRIRRLAEDLSRETLVGLDDLVDFKRSNLGDYNAEVEYDTGPDYDDEFDQW